MRREGPSLDRRPPCRREVPVAGRDAGGPGMRPKPKRNAGKMKRPGDRSWTAGLRAGERCPLPAETPAVPECVRNRSGMLGR